MAVHGVPSSYSSRISFNATMDSVRRLSPLKTVAYVPWIKQVRNGVRKKADELMRGVKFEGRDFSRGI